MIKRQLRQKKIKNRTFPTAQTGFVAITSEPINAVTPVPFPTIGGGLDGSTSGTNIRTLAIPFNPPPQLNHLHVQRHGRRIPKHLRGNRGKQGPTPCPRDVSVIKEHVSLINLGITTNGAVVLNAASEDFEMSL